jgi:hypothetical protein
LIRDWNEKYDPIDDYDTLQQEIEEDIARFRLRNRMAEL